MAAAMLALLAALVVGCRAPAVSHYRPRDARLRELPLTFYPSVDEGRPPRAVVVFFGNDVGFWAAHQQLAERLAGEGFSVAGFDVKRFLATLPDGVRARDSAYARDIGPVVAAARHELRGDSVPLLLGGHSIGAEIALWTAAHTAEPGLAGVLAMSPGSRGHLRVTLSDMMNSEPKGPDSFSVAEQIAALAPAVRVAIIRGQHDSFGAVDSALLAAGGDRVQRFGVPFAGHSMKKLLLAGPVVSRAMAFLVPDAR
jgi:pimeloyl-ACP methyl ester carboxylesterase